MVRLIMPMSIIPLRKQTHNIMKIRTSGNQALDRNRREMLATSFDKNVYIDAIGVPRGVPDQYKARNQIAAGFETIFLWPTINKIGLITSITTSKDLSITLEMQSKDCSSNWIKPH